MTGLPQTFTPSPIVAQLVVVLAEYEDMFDRCVAHAESSCGHTRELAQAGLELYGRKIMAVTAALPADEWDGRRDDTARATHDFDAAAAVELLLTATEEHEDLEEGWAQRACLAADGTAYARAMAFVLASTRRIAEIRAVLRALPRRRLDA